MVDPTSSPARLNLSPSLPSLTSPHRWRRWDAHPSTRPREARFRKVIVKGKLWRSSIHATGNVVPGKLWRNPTSDWSLFILPSPSSLHTNLITGRRLCNACPICQRVGRWVCHKRTETLSPDKTAECLSFERISITWVYGWPPKDNVLGRKSLFAMGQVFELKGIAERHTQTQSRHCYSPNGWGREP